MKHCATAGVLACCALLGVGASSTRAAESGPKACSTLSNDTDRLACYDKLFGRSAGIESATAKPEREKAPAPQFGLNTAAIERANPESEKAPTSISDTVSKLELLRDGRFVATLANGQVWTQTEIDSQAHVAVGDTVSVRRGAFGSYLLVTKDGVATRTKRVR